MKRWRKYPEDPPGALVMQVGLRCDLHLVRQAGLRPRPILRELTHLLRVMWWQRDNLGYWRGGWMASYGHGEDRIVVYGWTRRQALARLNRARDEGHKGA